MIAQGKKEVTGLPSTFNTVDEEMQATNEFSDLVFKPIFQVKFNIEVSPKTVRRMRWKLGWRYSTANKPK